MSLPSYQEAPYSFDTAARLPETPQTDENYRLSERQIRQDPDIFVRKLFLDSDQSVRLSIRDMGPALRVRPTEQGITVTQSEGVVAYCNALLPAVNEATVMQPEALTADSIQTMLIDEKAGLYSAGLAIGDGRRLLTHMVAGMLRNEGFGLHEPTDMSKAAVIQEGLQVAHAHQDRAVIVGEPDFFDAPTGTDYGYTFIGSSEQPKIAALIFDPDRKMRVQALSEEVLPAIANRSVLLAGWISLEPDGSVVLSGANVYLGATGMPWPILSVDTYERTPLANLDPELVGGFRQLLAQYKEQPRAAQPVESTTTLAAQPDLEKIAPPPTTSDELEGIIPSEFDDDDEAGTGLYIPATFGGEPQSASYPGHIRPPNTKTRSWRRR